jgi:hypothetical protein
MTVIAIGEWHDFFVAMAGAGAALAGLIIVAMTVTIKEILATTTLPSRAAATIAALVVVVIVSGVILIPGQLHVWLGTEVLVISLVALLSQILVAHRLLTQKPARPAIESGYKIVIGWLQGLPFVIGAVLILFGQVNGFGWIAAGILLAIVYAMVNAWVLLVEIQR